MEDGYYKTHRENPYFFENQFKDGKARTGEIEPIPHFIDVKKLLPEPFWEGHESAVECYWKTWELAFGNIKQPVPGSGFVSNFIDTAFNDHLFMWDSSFILLFCKYGSRGFNFQKTLDNFYAKQHKDGFICRQISYKNGNDIFQRHDPASTGPNIMPLTEWEYYRNFGDKERLAKVFPVLLAYHQWLRQFRTWRDGSYWSCGWGCGMDNVPRLEKGYDEYFSHGHQVWADTTMQQVLSGKILLQMAEVLGRGDELGDFEAEVEHLSEYINDCLWDEYTGFYYDLHRGGNLNFVKTVGAYWALLADIVPAQRVVRFVSHLNNCAEFKRPHSIPSLSADHPEYRDDGHYWRGSVWAPTNYMVLMGLEKAGYTMLAHRIALNHVKSVVKVFEETGTIWENYSAEYHGPGSTSRRDFVGWTGLAPVSVLFEHVFGLHADVPKARLVWNIWLLEEHGVKRYPFGERGLLDIKCKRREKQSDEPEVEISSNIPVEVELVWESGSKVVEAVNSR